MDTFRVIMITNQILTATWIFVYIATCKSQGDEWGLAAKLSAPGGKKKPSKHPHTHAHTNTMHLFPWQDSDLERVWPQAGTPVPLKLPSARPHPRTSRGRQGWHRQRTVCACAEMGGWKTVGFVFVKSVLWIMFLLPFGSGSCRF